MFFSLFSHDEVLSRYVVAAGYDVMLQNLWLLKIKHTLSDSSCSYSSSSVFEEFEPQSNSLGQALLDQMNSQVKGHRTVCTCVGMM